MSDSFDGSTNGRGENRQKFLREMMKLAPMVHASGILENRAAARKKGFQSVEDAVNKRLDAVAHAEKLRENEVNGWLGEQLFGKDGIGGIVPKFLHKWAARSKWPLRLLGLSIRAEHGKDQETLYDTTTVAIYRFWRINVGQRFIWGGVFHAGTN